VKEPFNKYLKTIDFQKKISNKKIKVYGRLKNVFLLDNKNYNYFFKNLNSDLRFLAYLFFKKPTIREVNIDLKKKKINKMEFLCHVNLIAENIFDLYKLIVLISPLNTKIKFNFKAILYKNKLSFKLGNLTPLFRLLDKNYSSNFINHSLFEIEIFSNI
jgi:hypothetical protein